MFESKTERGHNRKIEKTAKCGSSFYLSSNVMRFRRIRGDTCSMYGGN
jgi:hypothetical protein